MSVLVPGIAAYSLSGTGQLSAATEYIGYGGIGNCFTQSGGNNATSVLHIGVNDSSYQLSGGTLQVANIVLEQYALFDASNSSAVLVASGIVDLSNSVNLGGMSVHMRPNSLLIVPAGFDPSTGFTSYSSQGLTCSAGTPILIPAGAVVNGWTTINYPVDCQGTLAATASGWIDLFNGLNVSGTGTVALGGSGDAYGWLMINDSASGITGGSLSASTLFLGYSGTGTFTQSGGTVALSYCFYLGAFLPSIAGLTSSAGRANCRPLRNLWATTRQRHIHAVRRDQSSRRSLPR